MIVRSRIVGLIGASAMTVWPFIILHPDYIGVTGILTHERIHLQQQRRWAIYGLGVGLLAWFLLYLLVLPAWWNPWRRAWETEAYFAQGKTLGEIDAILRRRPYWLRW